MNVFKIWLRREVGEFRVCFGCGGYFIFELKRKKKKKFGVFEVLSMGIYRNREFKMEIDCNVCWMYI